MKPSNVYEFQIARLVDELSIDGKLALRSLADVTSLLNFEPTAEQKDYVERYLKWRLENPIAR